MTSRLWLLAALLILSQIRTAEATGRCHLESSIGGMALKGHTFKRLPARFPHECQFRCEEEVRCQSYNYVISNRSCEMNDRTKEARPEYFVPDWIRFYMKRSANRGMVFV